MAGPSKRYRAFISYSKRDAVAARRLHTALETYRLPEGVDAPNVDPATRKLGRFFRDDEEMSASTDLGMALEGAIADSENLIVVCSPNAVQSKWVNEEVLHFKRTGRAGNIFAVIVDGTPGASLSADPEERKQECFPSAVRFVVDADGALTDQPSEPLALDLRKEDFSRLCARLAAGLLRIPFDTLWQRDARRIAVRRLADFYALSLIGLALLGAAIPFAASQIELVVANQSPTAAAFPAHTQYEDWLTSWIFLAFAEAAGVAAFLAIIIFAVIRRFRLGTASGG